MAATEPDTCSLNENVDEYFLDEDEDFFYRNYNQWIRETDKSLARTLQMIEWLKTQNEVLQQKLESKSNTEIQWLFLKYSFAKEKNEYLKQEYLELMKEKSSELYSDKEQLYLNLSQELNGLKQKLKTVSAINERQERNQKNSSFQILRTYESIKSISNLDHLTPFHNKSQKDQLQKLEEQKQKLESQQKQKSLKIKEKLKQLAELQLCEQVQVKPWIWNHDWNKSYIPDWIEIFEWLQDVKKRYSNVTLDNARKRPTKFVSVNVNRNQNQLKSLLDVFRKNAKQIGIWEKKQVPPPKFWKKKVIWTPIPPKPPVQVDILKDEIKNIKGLYWACIDCFQKKISEMSESERKMLFGPDGKKKPKVVIGLRQCLCSKGHVINLIV